MMPEKMNFSDYCIPVREDIYYCLHNFKDIFLDKLNPSRVILLDTYKNGAENSDIKIDEVTFIDTKNKFVKLYQPWGTNLMPWEFKKPVFNNHRFVFWVGSIWNDKFNHGNIEEINNLKNTLCEKNIKFINVRFVPDWVNILLVRLSRIAPAIGGRIQTEVNYLPCRMFKNISYGQLGFSNVKKFSDLYKNCLLSGENIEQLVNSALDLSKDEYIRIVKEQQEITKKQTYLQKINNIFKTFDYIK